MASLSDVARAYVPPTTKNIADLEMVDVAAQVEDRKGKDKNGKDFEFKVIVVEGIEYRVPDSVLASLKSILAKKPTLSKFSVSKEGQGMNTKYTVIPLL